MSRRTRFLITAFAAVVIAGLAWLFLAPSPALESVRVADVVAPDRDDQPLAVRIWYPASVDADRGAASAGLPLVVISHGTGGSLHGHWDTAAALANAGYVVAAMNHTGDNFRDTSYIAQGRQLIGRSRHVSRVIDYVLDEWPHRDHVDPERIGLFGHSAGGFTALVVAGGQPDLTRGPERCRERPDAWDCQYVKKHGLDLDKAIVPPDDAWLHDPRVRAAVIAAPAIGHAFEPDRLADVGIPIQLWEAEHDLIVEGSPAIIRRLLPGDVEYRGVPGAGHFSFLAPCTARTHLVVALLSLVGPPNICQDPQGFDRWAFHELFNAQLAAFLARTLAVVAR